MGQCQDLRVSCGAGGVSVNRVSCHNLVENANQLLCITAACSCNPSKH